MQKYGLSDGSIHIRLSLVLSECRLFTDTVVTYSFSILPIGENESMCTFAMAMVLQNIGWNR
jgi:hypothetical protein